ncbi:hypothetical protein MAR_032029 [Mya arenaria]|uniref:Uncharacterized protein n=1 Tax=Mya arenaria TaxID=6604 RepID=A0ABY7F5G8_MYAAR|nr:hypothetical protein MAR_032029 [Mya arenaria]
MNNIEKRLDKLNTLETKVDSFDKDMKRLWTLVHDTNKQVDQKVSRLEEKAEQSDFNHAELKSSFDSLERQNAKLQDDIVYMKSQSMRNNIIFGGIEEGPNENQGDTEVKVRDFLKDRLKIAQELAANTRTRNIVCKFTDFKDREAVRKQGFLLKGSRQFISEQFPPEIMDIRRKLVPKLKEAKKDGKRAWLVYDTLYVDGKPVTSH